MYTDYQHTEFESGTAGTLFSSNGYNLRVEGLHVPIGPLRGAVGFEASNIKFSALGEEAFVPSTTTQNFAGFVYEELPRGQWKFLFGGRVASVKMDAADFPQAGQPADSRNFTPWSAAVGALYAFNPQWGATGNLSYTQRAPSVQELFANGPHLATDQFVVGDRNLNEVESTAVDLALKWKSGAFTSSAAAFYNHFSNYIALIPTGIFRNPEDRSVAPSAAPILDPVTGDVVDPVQQFNYQGVRARFWGIELKGGLPIWSRGGQTLTLGVQGDYVNAQDLTNGQPLPFIPPLRAGATLGYQREAFTAGLGILAAAPDPSAAVPDDDGGLCERIPERVVCPRNRAADRQSRRFSGRTTCSTRRSGTVRRSSRTSHRSVRVRSWLACAARGDPGNVVGPRSAVVGDPPAGGLPRRDVVLHGVVLAVAPSLRHAHELEPPRVLSVLVPIPAKVEEPPPAPAVQPAPPPPRRAKPPPRPVPCPYVYPR